MGAPVGAPGAPTAFQKYLFVGAPGRPRLLKKGNLWAPQGRPRPFKNTILWAPLQKYQFVGYIRLKKLKRASREFSVGQFEMKAKGIHVKPLQNWPVFRHFTRFWIIQDKNNGVVEQVISYLGRLLADKQRNRIGDDLFESCMFIYKHPTSYIDFNAQICLEAAQSQFSLKDIASVAVRQDAAENRKRTATEMSPASKIAAKTSRAEKWKEFKRQKREIKVLVTPQRD